MDTCKDCGKRATHKVFIGTEHMSAIGADANHLAPTFYCDDHYHLVIGRCEDINYTNTQIYMKYRCPKCHYECEIFPPNPTVILRK